MEEHEERCAIDLEYALTHISDYSKPSKCPVAQTRKMHEEKCAADKEYRAKEEYIGEGIGYCPGVIEEHEKKCATDKEYASKEANSYRGRGGFKFGECPWIRGVGALRA